MVRIRALLSGDPGLKFRLFRTAVLKHFPSVFPGKGQDGVGNYCATSASFSVDYLRTILFFAALGPCPSSLRTLC
jgi:hypothetical protein